MNLTTADGLAQGRSEKAGRYLTFMLGCESYGVPVVKGRDILRLPDITPVPRMPAYVRGVINLRGKVLPVIDLRLRFDFAEAAFTDRTFVVVVQVSRSDGAHFWLGLIVDVVEEVAQVTAEDIEPAPGFGGELNTDCMIAVARMKGGVSTLLDNDKIIAAYSGEKVKAAA